MTQAVLDQLSIAPSHDVAEFAPGLGASARIIMERQRHCRVGVERDPPAMRSMTRLLPRQSNVFVVLSGADETTLTADSISVVLGEAILEDVGQDHRRFGIVTNFREIAEIAP